MRRATSRWRALPDFLIIGAAKAGTTSLYAYLCAHPAVIEARRKEVNFFADNFGRGRGWYRTHFVTTPYLAWRRARQRQRVITGEGTPFYMTHAAVPPRVASVVPDAWLVVVLRDPVDRAYSQYQHAVRLGQEALSFEDAIAAEPARRAQLVERHGADAAQYVPEFNFVSYVNLGLYADQLAPWLEVFPREQLLVVRSEDLFAEPRNVLREAFGFLGVGQWDAPHDFAVYNAGKRSGLEPATRAQLAAEFAEPNQRLSELLDMDFGWST